MPNDQRSSPIYVINHRVMSEFEADIRATIAHAVRFALTAIWLSALLNSVLLIITRELTFAAGASVALAAAIIGFIALQVEQIARIAARDVYASPHMLLLAGIFIR